MTLKMQLKLLKVLHYIMIFEIIMCCFLLGPFPRKLPAPEIYHVDILLVIFSTLFITFPILMPFTLKKEFDKEVLKPTHDGILTLLLLMDYRILRNEAASRLIDLLPQLSPEVISSVKKRQWKPLYKYLKSAPEDHRQALLPLLPKM